MERTTVYLPTDLKAALRQKARASGVSEAELIRRAVAEMVSTSDRPRPRGGLFASKELAGTRDEEMLTGFGDR
jgi:hypothetical protein